MKIKVIILVIVLVLLLFGITLFFFQRHAEPKQLVLFGNVDVRQVNLGFRVMGRVEAMLLEEGEAVQPGDLMASLDKIPLKEELDQAKAKVDSLQAMLEKA